MKTINEKIKGSIFGMAIGDGFGYPTEFLTVDGIYEKWPPLGPIEPEGTPILVTDDTQMALAVGKSIIESETENFSVESLTNNLVSNYIEWLNDPRNNRAPGMTCMRAVEQLEKGLSWKNATMKHSKGCGANMRVIPVGLANLGNTAQIAQLQSAITHAHPTALAASDITAVTVLKLLEGLNPKELLEFLFDYSNEQKEVYHGDYLGEIWDRPPFGSPEKYISHGWGEIISVLEKVKSGLKVKNKVIDPCLVTGEGWIAEEAFGTALYCFLLFPDNAVECLKRAIVSSGDSDSIGCLAGGFVGATNGISAFPKDWIERIEYKADLEKLSEYCEKRKDTFCKKSA